ncbi:MAG: metal-dependent transcriptional regulator [Bradymonadales bacterium]|nr:metal-dependent transcriptional regulator [Bradymonadales bacterium]
MAPADPTSTLTGALEDYLETIFLLVRDKGFARVRDIAMAREVKSGSVSPALKRLSEMGLVNYERREYVGLTAEGEREARRVLARHDLLGRFFSEILGMSGEAASREACAMEHSLSAEAMDRLVRFFEFLTICPEMDLHWLEKFHCCTVVQEDVSSCTRVFPGPSKPRVDLREEPKSVTDLVPGREGRIRQVRAQGAVRQRLLDLGLLPEVVVRVERVAPTGDPIWISLQGSHIALRRCEAESVLISEE